MSDLNLEWTQQNFGNKEITFFNIGCADITDDTLRFTVALPNAKIYSFECAELWKQSNLEKAQHYQLNYEHKAVSYFDGTANFFTATAEHSGSWQYRGTFANQCMLQDSLPFTTQEVEVISLNTFCKEKNIKPNFLHIDAEGEEYNILKNLNDNLLPEAIWLEHWKQYRDDGNNFISFEVLDAFLKNKQYSKIYHRNDVLYVKDNFSVTPYIEYIQFKEYIHEDYYNFLPAHEKQIQQNLWLLRYNLIKDPSWPTLTQPKDFFSLSNKIQDECKNIFNLEPHSGIC